MSAPRIERLAIVGLGLLGGSVALAARRAGITSRIVGIGRRREPLDWAERQGLIDEASSGLDAVAGADWVVLATPVGSMERVLREAVPHLMQGALVTDVGSVKGALVDTLPGLLPSGTTYIGAHPMAGSHLRGVEHSQADLFDGSVCAVTPLPGDAVDAVERVCAFWAALGCRVVLRDPDRHDAEVAWTSHVPHVMAFAFASALSRAPERAGELAGAGFRDFTRIARSDAELWGDILAANRKALVGPLHDAGEALRRVARCIEAGEPDAIEALLTTARETLAAVENARGQARKVNAGDQDPEITAARNARRHP